jgi:hypothetical protein
MPSTLNIRCAKCGNLLPKSFLGVQSNRPCEVCGSLSRNIKVGIEEALAPQDHVQVTGRSGDKNDSGDAVYEVWTGESFHTNSGTWHSLRREIHRQGNERDRWRYRELVRDRLGNVVRDVDEPLTAHRGRGAARPKVWRLTPRDPSAAEWSRSSYCGVAVVRAASEKGARRICASAFRASPNREPPWTYASFVQVERESEPKFLSEGPSEVLWPEKGV